MPKKAKKPRKVKGFTCSKCKVGGWCYRYFCGCGSFCYNCAPHHLHGEMNCGICNKVGDWDHSSAACDEVT